MATLLKSTESEWATLTQDVFETGLDITSKSGRLWCMWCAVTGGAGASEDFTSEVYFGVTIDGGAEQRIDQQSALLYTYAIDGFYVDSNGIRKRVRKLKTETMPFFTSCKVRFAQGTAGSKDTFFQAVYEEW